MPRSDRNSTHPAIAVVGSFPPPDFGNALILKAIVENLTQYAKLDISNTSSGPRPKGIVYHVVRCGRTIAAVGRLITGQNSALYHNVDAGLGLIYSFAIVLAARGKGCRLFLHHHTCSYLDRPNRWMAMFIRLAGNDATHILLSRSMEKAFSRAYSFETKTEVVLNAGLIEKSQFLPPKAFGPLVLGHLGRLGPKKGLQEVLSTFAAISKAGPVRLILAGPPEDDDSRLKIEAFKAKHPGLVEWWGPVSGARKEEFYNTIDAFLFPVRQNEAQPLVLLEAMQHGRPCIAYARDVISEMLVGSGGVIIDQAGNFVEYAPETLLRWLANRATLAQAAVTTRLRFEALFQDL